MRENCPIKFFMDLEFEPLKFEENKPKEYMITEMIIILKKYIIEQWKIDTSTYLSNDYWIEFDSSKSEKKISRHLHNDAMVFSDIDHLFTFMKRIQTTIFLDIQKGNEEANKLIVFREKNGKKKKELFFDMLVYTRNRCMRLPWSTKYNEQRHFYPVLNGEVRRDMITPQWELFHRSLSNYWLDGYPPSEPFSYPTDLLEER